MLKVISSSPGELSPVFNAMLDNAARICEAKLGILALSEGNGKFRVAAMHGAPPELAGKENPRTGISQVRATTSPSLQKARKCNMSPTLGWTRAISSAIPRQ